MKKLTTEEFIMKAISVHDNNYGYSDVVYIKTGIKVKIWCKNCKEYFYTTPRTHLRHDCFKCGIRKHEKNVLSIIKKASETFKIKANKIHDNKYIYDKFDYKTAIIKGVIICKKCKIEFKQSPNNHLRGNGCPTCNESKGEKEIQKILNKFYIKCFRQKTFKECRNKRKLPFDFYLPEHNICIEYQGRQHYELVNFGGKLTKKQMEENLKTVQKNDKIKNNYCIKNNIKLIEIYYKKINNIEDILIQEVI